MRRLNDPACRTQSSLVTAGNMFLAVILVLSGRTAVHGQENALPHLRQQGTATQLIVHGKPYLVLGGELGNSTASSLDYLRPAWAKFLAMHLNTILAPVYWELIEPKEGVYDFSSVDSLIVEARRHEIRLVLLWFGTWKNSMSSYVPSWVKEDDARFPRSKDKRGRSMETLTAFSASNLDADKKIFATLMRHLRTFDGDEQTVIMIQVENEVGMIPDARDYNAEATKAFQSELPQGFVNFLQQKGASLQPEVKKMWESGGRKIAGNWEDVFGKSLQTDELFTAWYFSRYVEQVAAAGEKEYRLPMYMNAALIREGYVPGQYPSGGPLPHLLDVWKAGAPSVDLLAPDIYHGSFVDWTTKFKRADNPLFIPEAGLTPRSGVEGLFAVGQFDAIGFSPFAIESADPATQRLTRANDVLSQLAPVILEHQGKGMTAGMLLDRGRPESRFTFGEYVLNTSFEPLDRWAAPVADSTACGGGIIVQLGPNEFIVAGSGVIVTFQSLNKDRPIAGIESIDEGVYQNGVWKPGRRLNGDQSHQGRHMRLPYADFQIQRVKLYQYR
ncbi:MAG TPA: DUF5597 domain-containing protein [Bacteroidota bacterium]|nr:DUF5597 domain-containing protein [Bacteroidota bacterium]